MINLKNLKPRREVLSGEATFVVNLSDLDSMSEAEAERFLELNVFTGGMKAMLQHAARRVAGSSEGRSILKLSESMGGGKTQSLITAGILVKYPHLHRPDQVDLGVTVPSDCVVATFSGRNTNKLAWIEIGRQIGVDLPDSRPPSEEEWRQAFKDKKVLILLDELSFYLVGLTTQGRIEDGRQLSQRAALALTNMFGAIRDYKETKNVVAIVSDLQKDWEQGEEELGRILQGYPSLQGTVDSVSKEMSKGAMTISPVDAAKDEMYEILKRRLFESIPASTAQIEEIADAYAQRLEPIKSQLSRNVTKIKSLIVNSYPFHFSTKDLVSAFNMNPGFQKTRDVIRLFAEIVRSLWSSDPERLKELHTLSLVDADFNDPGVGSRLTEIKPVLQDARTTDVAASGKAHAETLSDQADGLVPEVAKWLYIGSLAELQVRGLDYRELIEYMARPGQDVSMLGEALEVLYDRCWYIERNAAGFYYFQRKKNLNARITDYVSRCSSVERDGVVAEKLDEMFRPRDRRCYQRHEVFPRLDEVSIRKDAITLLVVRPDAGIKPFFENALYKNRVMFLTAHDNTGLMNVNNQARRVWAIKQVSRDLEKESDATKGTVQEAQDRLTEYETQLFLAIQSVFNELLFPIADDDAGAVLERVDLKDSYQEGGVGPYIKYRNDVAAKGEFVVEATLREASKFVVYDLQAADPIRELQPLQLRIETFLFPQSNRIKWDNLLEQAAIRPEMTWTEPGTLERLKSLLIDTHHLWRMNGLDIEKGPFEERTGITVDWTRDDHSGEITITDFQLENADTVQVQEDNGGWRDIPTDKPLGSFAMRLEFRAVDSSDSHKTGPVSTIENQIELRISRKPSPQGNSETIQAESIPADAEVVYTVDGSDPMNFGVLFPADGVTASAGTTVRILARKADRSESRTIDVQKTGVDPDRPAQVSFKRFVLNSRQKSREFTRLLPDGCELENAAIIASLDGTEQRSVRWPTAITATKATLTAAMDFLEEQIPGCEEQIKATRLRFPSGAEFIKWRNETGAELKDEDVEQ